MATSSYLKSLFGGLDPDLKRVLNRAAEYLCDRNWRFGPVDFSNLNGRTENFAGRYVSSTTAAIANQEFSVVHNLGSAPGIALPLLDLTAVGSQFVGDLKVSRASDATRCYFTSGSTSQVFVLYLEK